MNVKQVLRCATAASFALVLSTAYAEGEKTDWQAEGDGDRCHEPAQLPVRWSAVR